MAIGFRAAGAVCARAGNNTNTLTVTLPASTAQNDLMLMIASSTLGGAPTPSTPSGWTVIDTKSAWLSGSVTTVLMYKVAGAAEGSASIDTGATSSFLDAVIVGFTGVDTTTPIDVTGTWAAQVNSATVTVPAITTVTANAWWLTLACDGAAQVNSSSKPSGWTQRLLGTSATTGVMFVASSVLVASAGATSATSYSRTGSSAGLVPIGIAIRESGATPPSSFVPSIIIIS